MKHYKLTVGQYHGYTDIEMDIPDEIRFFYNPGIVGRWICANCEHYTTIVESEQYSEWIGDFISKFGIDYETIGKYTVLTIISLHNNTPVPTIDREEWFKMNDIDLSQYTFVQYDEQFRPKRAYKIMSFQDVWNIDVSCINLGNIISDKNHFSICRYNAEWQSIEPITLNSTIYFKTYEGKEGKILWNSMFLKVLNGFTYEPKYADPDYNLLKLQDDVVTATGFKNWKELKKLLNFD